MGARMSISHSDSINFAPVYNGGPIVPIPARIEAASVGLRQSVLAPTAGDIGIVGAGNAAHSLACYLASHGFSPHMLVRSPEKVQGLMQRLTIKSVGKLEGNFSVVQVVTEAKKVLDQCNTIFIATTTDAYQQLGERLAPYLTPQHTVILFSSKFAGVVEFKNAISPTCTRRNTMPSLIETDTIFASRVQDDESVWIRGIKNWTLYSSWNCSQTAKTGSTMRRFFPGLSAAENIVQRGLTDFGALAHPITMIANMNNVDRNTGFLFYYEGFTENTIVLMERLEDEFQKIAKAYRTSLIPMKDLLNRYYGCDTSGGLLEAMRSVPNYSVSKAPGTLQHRFIEEDVASSLVPVQQLAVKAGLRTPMIDSIVNMATILLNRDFASDGRTLGKLGWDHLNHDEILRTIHE